MLLLPEILKTVHAVYLSWVLEGKRWRSGVGVVACRCEWRGKSVCVGGWGRDQKKQEETKMRD